jgi:hypothetical protein
MIARSPRVGAPFCCCATVCFDCERIENRIAHSCPDNERGASETKLHQTFGSNLIFFGTFHRKSTIVQRLFVGKSKSTFAKSGRIFKGGQFP